MDDLRKVSRAWSGVVTIGFDSQKNFTGPLWQFEWQQSRSMNLAGLCG